MNTENFTQWIMVKDNLEESSKRSYLRIPSKVDVFLNSHGYEYDRVMDTNKPEIIKEILEIPELKAKNARENRTISSSLNHYIKLLEFFAHQEIVEDQSYVLEVEEVLSKGIRKKKSIADDQEPVPPISLGTRNQHKRDNIKSAQAIVQADFRCEWNNSHQFFVSKKTGENYCEAHHIVPMGLQNKFGVSLDVYANLISLCPVCHRILHHGRLGDKREVLEGIYNHRIARMNACGINITLDELINTY